MGIDACGFITVQDGVTAEELNKEIVARFREDECFRLSEQQTGNRIDIDFAYSRHYSPFYERGEAMKIITTLEFLRRNEKVVEVFYHGDCTEEEDVDAWTKESADKYLDHWFKFGHKPYWRK